MSRGHFYNQLVLRCFTPFLKMGPIIYPAFLVLDVLSGHPFRWYSAAICTVQTFIFVSTVRLIASEKISPRSAHRIAYLTVCLVMVGCCFRFQVFDDPNLVVYSHEVMILIGMVMLDWSWFIFSTFTCVSLWAINALPKLPAETFFQQGAMCVLMTCVSATCFLVRRKVFQRQYQLHRRQQRQQAELSEAIETGARLSDQLDALMNERSQQLASTTEQLQGALHTQEELHQNLLHSQRIEAMGRLAGGVAHEFSNLLTIMMGYLYELRERLGANETLRDIESAVHRGTDLVTDLVSLTGQRALRRRVVTVGDVLSKHEPLMRGALSRGVRWEVQIDNPEAHLDVDPAALQQILGNLVSNCDHALAGSGVVKLTSYVHENQVRFEVADDGPGIPHQVRDTLFEPFSTTKPVGEGTGLGLAIARGVAESHGGGLELLESGPDGTRFRVELPLAQHSFEMAPEELMPCARGEQQTLLVVEDEPAILKLAKRHLCSQGYRVLTAENGEDALRVLGSAPEVELVVTDVVMPRMDGPTLVERASQLQPNLPFLFVSGYPDDRLEQIGLERETVDFLPKPYQLQELAIRVGAMLSSLGSPVADGR